MTNLTEVLIRREDAAKVAELTNDSIRDKGRFAAAIRLIPAYPAVNQFENQLCTSCSYPLDNEGVCVIDVAHFTSRWPAEEVVSG